MTTNTNIEVLELSVVSPSWKIQLLDSPESILYFTLFFIYLNLIRTQSKNETVPKQTLFLYYILFRIPNTIDSKNSPEAITSTALEGFVSKDYEKVSFGDIDLKMSSVLFVSSFFNFHCFFKGKRKEEKFEFV